MKNKDKVKQIKKFDELEKQLSTIDSEIENLTTKVPEKTVLRDSKIIHEEIKQLGKKPKPSFDELLNQAYRYLKAGDVKKASEIYNELEKMYRELAKALKKR